jgi:tetratricopeptide (TPR) repeat protein
MNSSSLMSRLKEIHTMASPWPARIFLCLAVLASYASVWSNEFVFDDMPLIVWNDFLKHWSSLPELLTSRSFTGAGIPGGFYRPVQMLIYFLIYQVFGLSTVAFHGLNIFIQVLNACLLHLFGIRAGFKKSAGFAAALLWAIHPLYTSNVAYMASTAELLWSCFCLMGLIALLPDFTPRRIWKAMIFFVLALGSKETAVVFPALAAVTFFFVSRGCVIPAVKIFNSWLPLPAPAGEGGGEGLSRTEFNAGQPLSLPRKSVGPSLSRWRGQRGYRSKILTVGIKVSDYLKMWPLWLLSVGYIVGRLLFNSAENGGSPVPFIDRILTSLATLPVYARLIVWPTGLHFDRVFPVFSTLLAWQPMAGLLIVALGLLQIFRGKAKALSFGLLWFAVAFSPYTGIVIPVNALINEGWLYMPSMGLFLGVTQTAAVYFERRQNAARLLVLVLALSLGIATFFQNEVWRNTETLYQNIPESEEYTSKLSLFLGPFYMEQGQFDKAIKHLQYEVDHPDGRPKILLAEMHLQLAMAWLHVSPDKGGAAFALDVHALPSHEHIPEAISELGKALQDNPDFYWAHAALAALYRTQGNNQMADFHDKKAREILQQQGGH